MARLASQVRGGPKRQDAHLPLTTDQSRELLSMSHKHLNVMSGTMVLAFKGGAQPKDFKAWADQCRMLAAQLDKGWVQC